MAFWCKGKKDFCGDSSAESCSNCMYEDGSGGFDFDDDDLHGITVGQWISVKNRLPEISGSYLVAIKEKYAHDPKWEYHVDVADSHGMYIDGFWDTFNDWIEGQEVHVTHWMPLPEPPKEV